jgi:hypothetical protein
VQQKNDVLTLLPMSDLAALAFIGGTLTFIRQTFPSISENYLDMSDLRRASEVLFWEIA